MPDAKDILTIEPANCMNCAIEVVSKPHPRPNGCVAPRIEMLTYCVCARKNDFQCPGCLALEPDLRF